MSVSWRLTPRCCEKEFFSEAGLAIKLKNLGTEVVGAGVFSVFSGSKIIRLLAAK